MVLEVSTNGGLCRKMILFQWEERSLRRVSRFLFSEGKLFLEGGGGREWGTAEAAAPLDKLFLLEVISNTKIREFTAQFYSIQIFKWTLELLENIEANSWFHTVFTTLP